ncbi:hypothetical protein D3C87_325330 [compost metagenome]
MTKRKLNIWESVEKRLRNVFPYPWPTDADPGDDLNDYYDSANDPLIPFLIGGADKKLVKKAEEEGIEFVEFAGSFYENVDYDSIPQGTEDECEAVVKVDGEFYKVGLIFTSWSGYRLNEWAAKVTPKVIEVVVYE